MQQLLISPTSFTLYYNVYICVRKHARHTNNLPTIIIIVIMSETIFCDNFQNSKHYNLPVVLLSLDRLSIICQVLKKKKKDTVGDKLPPTETSSSVQHHSQKQEKQKWRQQRCTAQSLIYH